MRLDDERESTNVEVQSGSRSGFGFPRSGGGLRVGGGKMGCGTIIIILIAVFVFKVDPGALLGDGGMEMSPQQQTAPSGEPGQLTPIQSVGAKVLGSTERRWEEIFSRNGQRYPAPGLVYYNREGNSGCGAAQSAMGPFYCPADQKIYIDTTFFEELRTRFGVDGDFPMAYVIAHEVGHHIQTITGTSEKVRRAQERVSRVEGNRLQVAMELQADCYAGVWARNDTNLLEPGDIEEGLRAAEAIGDDTLQRASQGVVVPESFTHGSSQQRMAWLKRGLDTGDPAQCNTFGG
jgi:predicted metalloprotease